MKNKVTIFWFRRDLRIDDNTALFEALNQSNPVQPVFIFDRNILDKLNDKSDARVTFIHDELTALSEDFRKKGCRFDIR